MWIAKHIAADIEKKLAFQEVTTFLDSKDIKSGDSINESVFRNLEKCTHFVVLLSTSSLKSQWVLMEIGAALGLKKKVCPVRDKVEPSDLPKVISSLKAVDLNDLENELAAIAKTCRKKRL